MAQIKKQKSKALKGYALKVKLGLVPHIYDKSRKGYGQVRHSYYQGA